MKKIYLLKRNLLGIYVVGVILIIFSVSLGLLINPDIFYLLIFIPFIILIGLAHLLFFTVKINDQKIEIKMIFSKYSYNLNDLKEIFVNNKDLVLTFNEKPGLKHYQSVQAYLKQCKKNPIIRAHNLLVNDDLFKAILPSYKGKIIVNSFSSYNKYKAKLISLGANKECFD